MDAEQIVKALDISNLEMKLASGEKALLLGEISLPGDNEVVPLSEAPKEHTELTNQIMSLLGIQKYGLIVTKDPLTSRANLCLHQSPKDSVRSGRFWVKVTSNLTLYFSEKIYPTFVDAVKSYQGAQNDKTS